MPTPTVRMLSLGIMTVVASVVVFDGCYLFQRVGFRLADWQPRQSSLAGLAKLLKDRSAVAWVLEIPLPFPLEALRGFDVQLADTERPQSAYLLGSKRLGGWWYWYPAAALFKIPLPAFGLLIMALTHWPAIVRQGGDSARCAALCLLLPAAECAATIMVSTGTGSNAAFRYMLPTMASLYVGTGAAVTSGSRAWRTTAWLFLGWLVLNVALAVPDHLGWRNELGWALEQSCGPPVLIGDSLDWGQDLARLGHWVKRHADVGSTSVCVYGLGDRAHTVYRHQPPRPHRQARRRRLFWPSAHNVLHDYQLPGTVGVGGGAAWLSPILRSELSSRRPVDRVGRTIFVYPVPHMIRGTIPQRAASR